MCDCQEKLQPLVADMKWTFSLLCINHLEVLWHGLKLMVWQTNWQTDASGGRRHQVVALEVSSVSYFLPFLSISRFPFSLWLWHRGQKRLEAVKKNLLLFSLFSNLISCFMYTDLMSGRNYITINNYGNGLLLHVLYKVILNPYLIFGPSAGGWANRCMYV